jgi:perosamine synthetase
LDWNLSWIIFSDPGICLGKISSICKGSKVMDNFLAPATETNAESRSLAVYQQAVRKNFSFLKQTIALDDLYAKSIALGHGKGYLLPVCELHASDKVLIAQLADWRAENAFAYPSQFPVTIDGTAFWLRNKLLDVEDRLLFLVLDPYGRAVGHLGYANALNDQCEMEIDNVVRGVKDENKGIMFSAMQSVLDWAEELIGPRRIFLRVFSDNDHAIQFYRKLGFVDGELLPLRKFVEGDDVYYRPITAEDYQPADKFFLRMNYAPQRLVDGSERILTAGPSVSARESSYCLDAARNGWNHHWADYIKKFESTFAEYVGTKYALSTSSCTGALHIALAALGVGPGDEVIVPDITWVATANAVLYVGATPVFADIDPDHWCLDPSSFESLITERTKAVIPVHLYGHPAPIDRIMEIARLHHLYILEDAAPSIGAECRGKRVGTFGDFAAFSFQGAKVAVTGEGGMLVTDNEELYRKVYTIWDQGRVPGTFNINHNGWKYKMSNLQAAFGLGQLERLDELVEAKRRIFSWYAQDLYGVPNIQLNQEMSWARSIYWMTSLMLGENARLSRDELRDALLKRNIDTRPVFPVISQYPIWPRKQAGQPVARRVSERAINLPSGVCLKREQVAYICRCIREIIAEK